MQNKANQKHNLKHQGKIWLWHRGVQQQQPTREEKTKQRNTEYPGKDRKRIVNILNDSQKS